MVASAIVVLDRLPLTANGKVDRAALPQVSAPATDGHVEPRTAVEAVPAAVWSEVLGVDCIGVEDDFFALGGDSLLAMKTVSHLRRIFRCDLPFAEYFEARTVARLARLLTEREEVPGRTAHIARVLSSISDSPDTDTVPPVHPEFAEQRAPRS
jgi:acyl carrier protein